MLDKSLATIIISLSRVHQTYKEPETLVSLKNQKYAISIRKKK